MTETELQMEIKRLNNIKMQLEMQANFQRQQTHGIGQTFAAIVRELLLAIGDPEDVDQVSRAKKHAKELLKNWDEMMEKQNQPPPQPETDQQKNGPLKVVPPDNTTPS